MNEPLLAVEELEAGYDDLLIVRGVTLEANGDEIVSIIGPNGAGKTTLLKAAYGLLPVAGGRVVFAGEDVTGLRPDRLTRRGLNLVPQVANVFPALTLDENLEVGSLVLPRSERRDEIVRVIEFFPLLRTRARQKAGTLSGGERKLLALARALVARPKLLLLDEPSAGLSPAAMDLVFDKLLDIRAAGVGIVMVEQNARRALAISDRGYVLDTGHNAHSGSGRALLDDPRVVELYLGGAKISS
jgi:branched-chain amino acid transport system ATP-binding protein